MKTKNFMNYIKLKKYGAAENLIIQKKEIPKINDYEVLIEVYASGVNRPDVLQRKGLYAPPKGARNIGFRSIRENKKIGKKVKNLKLTKKFALLFTEEVMQNIVKFFINMYYQYPKE